MISTATSRLQKDLKKQNFYSRWWAFQTGDFVRRNAMEGIDRIPVPLRRGVTGTRAKLPVLWVADGEDEQAYD